jgi:molybdenum cofactor cytidylyltransferase
MAAGFSRRMGQPKLLLPWGESTVIGAVVATLVEAKIAPIVAVAGANHEQIQQALAGLPVHLVINQRFEEDSMVVSLQAGLASLGEDVQAALVVLGDQPQMPSEVIHSLVETHLRTSAVVLIPSYQMRRGHPWLVDRQLWPDILELNPGQTLRDFINAHLGQVCYVPVNTDTIFQDLDTPEDYARLRPK